MSSNPPLPSNPNKRIFKFELDDRPYSVNVRAATKMLRLGSTKEEIINKFGKFVYNDAVILYNSF